MTREVYVGVLKSVRAQLKLAADALDMCDFDGETADESALRERLSAGVHKGVLMLELDIQAAGRQGGVERHAMISPKGNRGTAKTTK